MENIPVDPTPINDSFANEQLANINVSSARISSPWFADYANVIVGKVIPPHFTFQQRKKFFYDLRHYFWDDPFLYKKSVDGIIRRCVPEFEQQSIIKDCHDSPYGGHHAGDRTAAKVLQSIFIGLLYLKIVLLMLKLVMNVNAWETLVREMKYL